MNKRLKKENETGIYNSLVEKYVNHYENLGEKLAKNPRKVTYDNKEGYQIKFENFNLCVYFDDSAIYFTDMNGKDIENDIASLQKYHL